MEKIVNTKGFYRFLEWLMWIMYLNMLWILTSLLGLIVLGIFPSTLGLVVTIRKWCIENEDIKFTRTYFKAVKQYFLKANFVGYLLMFIGYVLVVDFHWISQDTSVFRLLFFVLFLLLAICFIIILLYIFPVLAHFDVTLWRAFKHAIVIGLFSPFLTVTVMVTLFLSQYLWRYIPGLLPVVGVSFIFYLITRLSLLAFKRFELKQQQLVEKELTKGEEKHA